MTWNSDGLAKRFSCKDYKENFELKRGWDNKHQKLGLACKWRCRGKIKNSDLLLLHSRWKLYVHKELSHSCLLFWRKRRQTRKRQGDTQVLMSSAGNLTTDLQRGKINMNGVWKNIFPFCIFFTPPGHDQGKIITACFRGVPNFGSLLFHPPGYTLYSLPLSYKFQHREISPFLNQTSFILVWVFLIYYFRNEPSC